MRPLLALLLLAPAANAAPNIVFVLADDLGIGDVGPYGQTKIRTPNLDRLAAEGMLLTRHYSGNNVCAPSRCVLMTGKHPGHAVVRDNREIKPEGQFPLPAGTVTLPKLLAGAGYATGAFGKWGLGGPGSSGDPLKQGFGRFFGYNCQRVAHNYYPTHLWSDAERVKLNNPEFPAHDKFKPGENPADAASYARFRGTDYAPDRIAAQALAFLEANKAKPFFLYWPTTVPHLALQVPEDSLAEYAGKFPEAPYPGGKGYLPHPAPRAAYAAMVTRMDREIGRLMARVKELGLDRNTLFVFTSDNGPLYDQLGGTDCDFFGSAMGRKGRKGSMDEGGVRVPCVVRWPGTVPAGASSDFAGGFEDWLPTLLDAAGVAPPPGLDGVSLLPLLKGGKPPARPFLYRESPGYGGQQAVWAGDWKAVRRNLHPRGGAKPPPVKTELYHLADDPNEANDVAAAHPAVVAKLEALMAREHVPSKDFPIRALDGN